MAGSRRGLRRVVLTGLAAVGLVALGAAGATVVLTRVMDHGSMRAGGAAPEPAAARPAGDAGHADGHAGHGAAPSRSGVAPRGAGSAEVEVLLAPETVAQAGIKTAPVRTAESRGAVQVPGTVAANAYSEVKVTSLAGGVVTDVHVELGGLVRRGQPLARIFSTDLAEAQTRYLSMLAMLEADQSRLDRTRRLVEIGAASRQELEEATAAQAGRATEVEAARQRLRLLGLAPTQIDALKSPRQIVSEVVVPAPIDGVLTGRSVNLGQVVGTGQELFVVTDLSTVWVVGDLYEQDLRAIRVGSHATITTAAFPDLALRGRVAYIDPRVDPQTRTAKARVEVSNPAGRLRLGMYATMSFATGSSERRVLVPRAAVQSIGDRHVVYLPDKDDPNRFVERAVRLGPLTGDAYAVLSGVAPGDRVVVEGSFFLRAERLRNEPLS
jgi:cobalt-zinc-cadmium efflux system membrane fusion protein